jgi:broad specificity phosphatase PhoE
MTTATTAQTIILLIRHGRTVWNKDTVFRGRADIPLDDTG